MSSLAARRLLSGLDRIRASLDAGDYPALERQIADYDAGLRACLDADPNALSQDDYRELQRRQADLQAAMHRLRDEAADWLRNDRRTRHAIQAYAGLRTLRRRGAGAR